MLNEKDFKQHLIDETLNVNSNKSFVICPHDEFISSPVIEKSTTQIILQGLSGTVFYTLDGVEGTYSDPIDITSLHPGEHVLVAWSEDGSLESPTVSQKFVVVGESSLPTISRQDSENQVVVSITCPDEGAVLRYTLDGSEPNEYSPVYEEPITFDTFGDWSVSVKAFTPYCTPSGVVKTEFSHPLGETPYPPPSKLKSSARESRK